MTAEATLPPDRAIEIGRFKAPAATDSFHVIDARTDSSADFDPLMQVVVFTEKPKRLAFPAPTIAVDSVPGVPGAFTFSTDVPAFFVKPEAEAFDGAFDDASVLLLPGEPRTLTFRSYDGRMPEARDLTVSHLAATYR
jgi:beta-mannosidase